MVDKSLLKHSYWLLLIIILGVLIRFFNLEVRGLWMDEIHSAVGADPSKTLNEVIEYCKQDQPPVFFLLLHYWYKFFGYSDFSGRILGLITGSLGIISMYFLGIEFKNSRVAILSALLTAINYIHVDHSRQVRFYPLVFLFSSLSYLFFLRTLKNKKPINFFFYTLATAALLNTHYFGMVVLASQFILFVFIIYWKKIRDVKFITYSLLSGVLAGLSFLYWLPVVMSDLKITKFHLQQVTWYFPIEFYWVYFRDVVTCIICAGLSFFVVREMFLRMRMKSTKIEDVVLVGWIGLGFLIPLSYSVIRVPMLEYRYTFIVVPAILMIVALGFESDTFKQLRLIKPNRLTYYLIIILFFAFFINAFFGKTIYKLRQPQQQWREVTQEVMKTDAKTQAVLANYAWYFQYYFKIYKSYNLPVEPRYADVNALVKTSNSLWVITSRLYPDDGVNFSQQGLIDANFQLANESIFYDFKVKHYTKR